MRKRRGRPPHADVLTPAEWRVVHAVQHGLSNREIARRRGISADAVKFHVANAVAKLGLTDRRALRHWFAAPAGSALALAGDAMGTELKLGPLAQVSRTVRDVESACHFYGQTLGLTLLYRFGALAFFDCGGTRLFLSEGQPGPESILYLRVADIRTAHRELAARGVAFSTAPHLLHRHSDGTEEWLAAFADPDGRPLALMSQVKP